MPDFKKVEFIADNDAGAVDKITIPVKIRTDGTFYAHVPNRLRVSFDERRIDDRARQTKGHFTVSASTFQALTDSIEKAHKEFLRPDITTEPVIRYNIESHVNFALTKDGRIFPNALFPGASWPESSRELYGNHHATAPAHGGYSLTIGAEACLKTTTTYGDKSQVSYEPYHKGGRHLGADNPAELLNSWVGMDLPEDAREMPYSDEAAMFFFNLLQSMAELNYRIQEFTNTPEKLARAISRTVNLLPLKSSGSPTKNG